MLARLVSVLVMCLALTGVVNGQSTEAVTFPSLDKGFHGQLTGTIYKPVGDGPFPAMVLLHTCAGIQPFVGGWAQWFADHGSIAIAVDSFGPRGVTSVCGVGGNPDEEVRAADAYGALAYLRTRKDVDGARIGVIGWSHGGGAALVADNKAKGDALAPGSGFRAVVALYPVCDFMPRHELAAPLLVLLGSADDWTTAPPCDRGVKALAGSGQPASDYIYPGATHGFDNPADRGVTSVHKHTYTMNYNPDAAQDARTRVAAFLADALK